jgi:hypothetical protein
MLLWAGSDAQASDPASDSAMAGEPLGFPGCDAEGELGAPPSVGVLDQEGLVSQDSELPHETPLTTRRVHGNTPVGQHLRLLFVQRQRAARSLTLPLGGLRRCGCEEADSDHQGDGREYRRDTLLDTFSCRVSSVGAQCTLRGLDAKAQD